MLVFLLFRAVASRRQDEALASSRFYTKIKLLEN